MRWSEAALSTTIALRVRVTCVTWQSVYVCVLGGVSWFGCMGREHGAYAAVRTGASLAIRSAIALAVRQVIEIVQHHLQAHWGATSSRLAVTVSDVSTGGMRQ